MAERRIGMYIQNDCIRAIELEKTRDGVMLRALAQKSVQTPFSGGFTVSEPAVLQEYGKALSEALGVIFSARDFTTRDVYIAIDIRNAFVASIPAEPNQTKEQYNDSAVWEISTLFPDVDRKQYVHDVYQTQASQNESQVSQFVVTALMKEYLSLLRQAVTYHNASLCGVNIDHFTIDNVLLHSSRINRNSVTLVCFIRDNILFCSLLHGKTLKDYREFSLIEPGALGAQLTTIAAAIDESGSYSMKNIFLLPYQKFSQKDVSFGKGWKLNPLSIFGSLELSKPIQKGLERHPINEEEFVPAIGVALRGFV